MRYSLSYQGCRCAEAAGIPVGQSKKKLHMVMQQVCTGIFLLQRSLFKSALVWLAGFFCLLIYSWNLGTGSKTSLTLKGHGDHWKTFSLLAVPSKILKHNTKVLLVFRVMQQQMAVERGTRFLLTGPSLEPCSPWTLDINSRKRNICYSKERDGKRAELDITVFNNV